MKFVFDVILALSVLVASTVTHAKTYTGTLGGPCDKDVGYGSSIDIYPHGRNGFGVLSSDSVCAEVAAIVATNPDQCVIVNVQPIKMVLPDAYVDHAVQVSKCAPGSAAQREIERITIEDHAASKQAAAYCAGKSRRAPDFYSEPLNHCRCGNFGDLTCN